MTKTTLDMASHDIRLARIGPSTAWAYRRLNEGLMAQPDGYEIDLEALAAWLGLGDGTGQNSPLVRSLRRLVAVLPGPAGR